MIDGWRNGTSPTLNTRPIPFAPYDIARSVAIAPDAKRFFLGSNFALAAFDDAGTGTWRWPSRNAVWAVNASRDGRIIVTADGDGAIRWHRADDGRELMALQVLPNGKELAKWDWVLWTPEGFYEATPGAEDVLKWVVNHGPDKAATTLPVSAIAKLHRPNALPLVLDKLETARALGVDDITQARLDVQAKTGSVKPPGGGAARPCDRHQQIRRQGGRPSSRLRGRGRPRRRDRASRKPERFARQDQSLRGRQRDLSA